MNIKTINNLTEITDLNGYFGIGADENGSTAKYEIPPVTKGIHENTVSIGGDNIVGLKGYYYKSIDFTTNKIYLASQQTTPNTEDFTVENIICEYEVGDILSIINDSKYDKLCEVTEIGIGYIIVNSLPFTEIDTELNISFEDFSIYCLSKPTIGISNLGLCSFASGFNNFSTNGSSSAFGGENHAYGKFSFCAGRQNEAGYSSQATGWGSKAIGYASHAEGYGTTAGESNGGRGAHAEGQFTVAVKNGTHAEGMYTQALATCTHAEGQYTVASGKASHAEGLGSEDEPLTASGNGAHAEGQYTVASGKASHAEGNKTQAIGGYSHAEGTTTQAIGSYSHAEGNRTIANNNSEHACGQYNASNTGSTTAEQTIFSIGIGKSSSSRKNAIDVRLNGDIYIWVGATQYKLQDLLTGAVTISSEE